MVCLEGIAARKPANGRASTVRSMPCLLNTPASFAPVQFRTKTLFWGMTAVTFSKVSDTAVPTPRTGINKATQDRTNLLFIPTSRLFAVPKFEYPPPHLQTDDRPSYRAARACGKHSMGRATMSAAPARAPTARPGPQRKPRSVVQDRDVLR